MRSGSGAFSTMGNQSIATARLRFYLRLLLQYTLLRHLMTNDLFSKTKDDHGEEKDYEVDFLHSLKASLQNVPCKSELVTLCLTKGQNFFIS